MNDWLSKVFDHPDLVGCAIIVAKTIVIYLFLIVGLRLLGKRELGQMNIFDLLLIIVLGNAVQNAMMNNDNTLCAGLIAATTLLVMNRTLTMIMHRNKRIERSMVGQPMLILSNGVEIKSRMEHEGITHEQLMQALREHGITNEADVRMCILEVDGSISVVPKDSEVMRSKRHFKAIRIQ